MSPHERDSGRLKARSEFGSMVRCVDTGARFGLFLLAVLKREQPRLCSPGENDGRKRRLGSAVRTSGQPASLPPPTPLDSGPYAFLPAAGIGLPRVLSTWSSAIWSNHGSRRGRCQGLQGGHRIMTCFVACFYYPGPLTGSSLFGVSRKLPVCRPLASFCRSRPDALWADRRPPTRPGAPGPSPGPLR